MRALVTDQEIFMNAKIVVRLLPVCLGLFSGAARADLEPFSFAVSESVQHQSNINREPSGSASADWLSTTELRAALDQRLGRDELTASLKVAYDKYKHSTYPNTVGYAGAVGLDWSTVGDLSGTLTADSERQQYLYGIGSSQGQSSGRNIETTNHAGGTVQLGGQGRWVLFAGGDASNVNYSASTFASNEERQWSANGGTRYQTSSDLSFGLQGSYTHGEYPNLLIKGDVYTFSLRSVDLTTRLKASGSSALDARIGMSSEQAVGQSDQHFVNGALSWNWSPPSHFNVFVGISRDANSNTTSAATITDNSTASLTGRSINNAAHVSVTYSLTAKISLVADGQYVQRKYSNSVSGTDASGNTTYASGSNRTGVYGLAAHYAPTRTTDLGCGYNREIRHTDASLASLTPGYTDNTVQCSAAIKFN
jgi:hypothetical protein